MAFSEVRDFLIKLRTDSTGVEQGNSRAQRSFTELNSALELARKGFEALKNAGEFLERGNNYNQVARGFESISKSVGVLADEQLTKLRAAVGGTVSDLQLMEQANKAVLLGLDATKLDVMAEAAQRLGAAVGRTGTESFQDLVTGVGRGSALILDNLGVIVSTEDAYKKFAKQLGVTADQLSEAGKKAAFQEAALKAIKEKAESLPPPVLDAGRAFQQLQSEITNMGDSASGAAAQSTGLLNAILALIDGVQSLKPLISEIKTGFDTLFGDSSRDIENQLAASLENKRALLESANNNFFVGSILDENVLTQQIKELETAYAGVVDQRLKMQDIKVREDLVAELQVWNPLAESLKNNKDRYIDTTAAKKETAKASDDLKKKIEEQKKAYTDLNLELRENSLKKSLEQALEKVDPNSFNLFFDQYSEVFGDRIYNGLLEKLGSPDKAKELTTQLLDLEKAEWAEQMQVRLQESFQQSVDFFADLLTPMFEGQAANFEDIFIDAAKRVAIGFASQMAASLASQLGFSGLSNIGSAQGLGQMLASYLGFGGPSGGGSGGGGWGNILSSGSSLYSGYQYLTGAGAVADFNAAAMADYGTISGYYEGSTSLYAGGSSAATGASLTATLGIMAGVAAGAYAFYDAVKTFESSSKEFNDSAKAGAQTYFAGDPSGFSQLYFALAGNFSGSNDPGVLARRDLRGALQETGLGEDLTFRGIRGTESIFDSRYVQDPSNPQNAAAIALANPIANVFTQGDDTFGPQLAAMFADATDNADNFNEVLINTQSLMDKMGVNSEQLKTDLADIFLDGKISLEEFGTGLQQLNILATDNLVGPSSISDAINILAKNIDDNPRVAIKGLELAFKEMAEVGIDTQSEITDYATQNFSPEVAAAFKKLLSVGIDTWQEIGEAGPDALFQIISAFEELAQKARESAEDTGDSLVSNIGDAADRAKRRVEDLGKSLQSLNNIKVNPSVTNPNQPNNPRPA